MASPAKIIERIRANGANVVIDEGRLKIVNGSKLPDGARDFIKANAGAIAEFLEREHEVEERAAIIEYDGGAPREMAEQFAKVCIGVSKGRWPEIDRSWFVGRCAALIDDAAALEDEARAAA